MVARSAAAGVASSARSMSVSGRLLDRSLAAFSAVLQRLPDRPLHMLAHGLGQALYALQPARRQLVRANLARVCRYLAAADMVAPDSPVALAAANERVLERLVRHAFGHYLRSYLELLIVPAYARAGRLDRLTGDDPALVEAAFGTAGSEPRPAIIVALHFGAMEIPGLWATRRGLRLTAPMETLGNAGLQRFLQRSRGASGLRLIPAQGAGRQLVAALGRDEVVALVADRVVAGSGTRVELFGAATRLPLGPAALAVDSGAAAYVVAVRRSGWGTYRAHLERVVPVADGSRRERLAAFMQAEARAFERAVAAAPEQWWTLFFEIWRDD